MTTVLVAYGSRLGSTKGIAERIAARLRTHGIDTTACDVQTGFEPGRYDAFVIGSAVYAGHWLKDVTRRVGLRPSARGRHTRHCRLRRRRTDPARTRSACRTPSCRCRGSAAARRSAPRCPWWSRDGCRTRPGPWSSFHYLPLAGVPAIRSNGRCTPESDPRRAQPDQRMASSARVVSRVAAMLAAHSLTGSHARKSPSAACTTATIAFSASPS